MERTIPLLVQKILPDIKSGKTVLVVAHANSLRGKDWNMYNINLLYWNIL